MREDTRSHIDRYERGHETSHWPLSERSPDLALTDMWEITRTHSDRWERGQQTSHWPVSVSAYSDRYERGHQNSQWLGERRVSITHGDRYERGHQKSQWPVWERLAELNWLFLILQTGFYSGQCFQSLHRLTTVPRGAGWLLTALMIRPCCSRRCWLFFILMLITVIPLVAIPLNGLPGFFDSICELLYCLGCFLLVIIKLFKKVHEQQV